MVKLKDDPCDPETRKISFYFIKQINYKKRSTEI